MGHHTWPYVTSRHVTKILMHIVIVSLSLHFHEKSGIILIILIGMNAFQLAYT